LDKISLTLNAPKVICTPQNVTLKIAGASNLSNVSIKNETTGEVKSYTNTTNIDVFIDKTSIFSIVSATINGFNCAIELPKTSVTILLNVAKIEISTIKEISCTDSKNGVIEVVNSQGSAPFSYKWNTGSTDNSLKNLDKGTYSVTMTDYNGCTASATTILTAPKPILVQFASQSPCVGQSEGSITLKGISGGTGNYSWTFNDNPMPISSLPYTFDKLKSGNYLLSVFDANNCEWKQNININTVSTTKLKLQADSTLISPSSEVELHTFIDGVKGNTQNIKSFSWNYGNNMRFEADSLAPIVHILDSIKNSFKLNIIDKNGCAASASITIRSNGKHHVGWPNVVIYPNELFTLIGNTVKQIDQLKIFSRWGELVYQQENILSDRKIGWDGTLNGQNLDPGVFVFIAKITFIDGTEAFYKGDITLLK
jgi:gliding motility-associated-like protein